MARSRPSPPDVLGPAAPLQPPSLPTSCLVSSCWALAHGQLVSVVRLIHSGSGCLREGEESPPGPREGLVPGRQNWDWSLGAPGPGRRGVFSLMAAVPFLHGHSG